MPSNPVELPLLKLAIKKGILTKTDAQGILSLYKKIKKNGKTVSIVSLLQHKGLLSDSDLEAIQKALNQQALQVPSIPGETEPQKDSIDRSDSDKHDSRPPEEDTKTPHIGPFIIVKELGSGGMGRVYLAYHPNLDKNVAVKVILSDGTLDPVDVERFLREARLAASLRHPNLVKVYDIGKHGDDYFIVMDYVEGVSLSSYVADLNVKNMRNEGIALNKTLKIMEQICLAMDYVHCQGIIHRDLKPQNIIVDSKDKPIVIDFGLAKSLSQHTTLHKSGEGIREESGLTHYGDVIGTPEFMAPEQLSGELDKIDRRTDVYALGAMLYFILTGKPHVESSGKGPSEILYTIMRKGIDPPSEAIPELPSALDSICLKALANKPRDRYSTAADMAEDIRSFLEEKPKPKRYRTHNPAVSAILFVSFLIVCIISVAFIIKGNIQTETLVKDSINTDVSKHDNKQWIAPRDDNKENRKEEPENNGEAKLNDHGSQKIENVFKTEHNFKPGEKLEDIEIQGKEEREKMAKFHKELGVNHYLRKEYDQALEEFTKAISYNPLSDPLIYNYRAAVYYNKKQYNKALADLTKALAIDKTNEIIYENRGNVYYEIHLFNEALEDYKSAIKINPKDPSFYYHIGNVFLIAKKYEQAFENYAKAIEYNPKYFEVYNNRGHIYYLQKRYSEAMIDFDKAISINPKNVESYCNRGILYVEINKPELAIKDFEKIQSIAPNHKQAQEWLKRLKR